MRVDDPYITSLARLRRLHCLQLEGVLIAGGYRLASDLGLILLQRWGYFARKDIKRRGWRIGEDARVEPCVLGKNLRRRMSNPFGQQHGAVFRKCALVEDQEKLGSIGIK